MSDRKKGVAKNGVTARSQNIPADIVEAIEKIRKSAGKSDLVRPSFSRIVIEAIRVGLPKIARQASKSRKS